MITGETLYLRALEPNDLDLLYDWENDVALWDVADTFAPFSRHQIEQYLLSVEDIFANKQLRLMICLKENDRAIGCIDLFEYNAFHSRAGVGILIAKSSDRLQGKGEEALNLLISYAFTTLNLHQLFANISVLNTQSQKLFEKCGFKKAGVKKGWRRVEDIWIDELFYQQFKSA